MDRLNFTLPDFCRVAWASEAARQRWSPIIDRIASVWRDLEIETVRQGARKIGLVALRPSSEPQHEIADLTSFPLYTMSPRTMYVSDRHSAPAGNALIIHAVGAACDVDAAVNAFRRGEDDVLGQLLGYPECCIAFFADVWNRRRHIDTTWPMALGSAPTGAVATREFEAEVSPATNMLLRWIGIRPVFHLPCSFCCEGSKRVADEIKLVATKTGRGEAMDQLYQILQWPVQWSALHGIAEIETPVLRISVRTDSTAQEYKVRLTGGDPDVDQAPAGTRFPYRKSNRSDVREIRITRPPTRKMIAYDNGAAAPWLHSENGFASLGDLHRALAPIARSVVARKPSSVGHLWCKNGALLQRIVSLSPDVAVHGLDPDPLKIDHARLLLPNHAAKFQAGQVDDERLARNWPELDVCVVMLGRILELPNQQARETLRLIRARAQTVVVYAFDDWLRLQSLDGMAALLGLKLCRPFGEESSVAHVL